MPEVCLDESLPDGVVGIRDSEIRVGYGVGLYRSGVTRLFR